MDSLATLNYPALGYGLKYEFGLFKQRITKDGQGELSENWLEVSLLSVQIQLVIFLLVQVYVIHNIIEISLAISLYSSYLMFDLIVVSSCCSPNEKW